MTKIRIIYFLLLAIIPIVHTDNQDEQSDPESENMQENGQLDFTGLATKYGHPPIKYEVITEDGYILTMYRLPGKSEYPLLLMHGIMDTSDTFFIRGENSLGVMLADHGYDVWCPNSRGNRYSRRHVSLDPDTNPLYWDWSFHELGYYDLPAIIDKILNETQAPTLSAIGHSRGNVIFYVLGATRPEYNSKINLMIAIAPVSYLNFAAPSVAIFMEFFTVINDVLDLFKIKPTSVFDYNGLPVKLLQMFCPLTATTADICLRYGVGSLLGYDPVEIRSPFVNVFIYHFPAGTSWKDVAHFVQIKNSKQLLQYDYGAIKNLLVYNSVDPPIYNLTQVTMPMALMSAPHDPMSGLPDAERLAAELGNLVYFVINRQPMFTHMDFVWGKHIPDAVFPELYRILSNYNDVDFD